MSPIGVTTFLQRSIVAVLGICLALPLHLFCSCVCNKFGRECCQIQANRLPEAACDSIGNDDRRSWQECCACCRTDSRVQTVAERPAAGDQTLGDPWPPCPCGIKRTQQALAVQAKTYKQYEAGCDFQLYPLNARWIADDCVRLETVRLHGYWLPLSCLSRLALLSVWLN